MTKSDPTAGTADWLPVFGKIGAAVLFLIVLLIPGPNDLPPAAQRLAAVTALMAVLWMTQAIPVAATSLIPLVAFPLLGIRSADAVSKSYIDKSIFLFLGGFIIALGIEKWGLHRRIALHVVTGMNKITFVRNHFLGPLQQRHRCLLCAGRRSPAVDERPTAGSDEGNSPWRVLLLKHRVWDGDVRPGCWFIVINKET